MSDPEIVRRKFTLSQQLDQQLVTMANDHYTGNVSLCLRQAIQDHKASLAGESRLTLKRLRRDIQNVQAGFEDLHDVLELISERIDTNQSQTDAKQNTTRDNHRAVTGIREELATCQKPLRCEDLAERLDLKQPQVRRSLGRLIDLGYVTRSREEPNRYQLVTCVPEVNVDLENVP